MEIINPWVIVHQPLGDGDNIETILVGPPHADHRAFGIVIADIIRHVAKRFGVAEADVHEWVQRELVQPPSTTMRIGPN